MRNWLSAFRPASFRGVAFQVETESASGGRRVAASPIAYSDRHVTEDMGGRERRFQLTAYVAGDESDRAARAFAAALQAPGAGTLVLPLSGPVSAHVSDWGMNREKRVAGYVAFDVGIILAGGSQPLFAAVPGSLQIAGLVDRAAEMFAKSTVHAMRDAKPVLDASVSASARAAAASLQALGTASVADAEHRSQIDAAARHLILMADAPGGIGEACARVVASAVSTLIHRGESDVLASAFSQSINPGDDPVALTVLACLAAGHAHALCATAHASRQDARMARSKIAPVTDPAIVRLGSGGFQDVAIWLEGIAAIAADDLSATAANRAPLVRVETGQSMPASALAYALYGDAGRAGEIVTRNRASTPAVMPVILEALAS